MYTNIIVAVSLDHSPDGNKAFEIAQLLANEGAKITALHVIEEIPSYIANQIPEEVLANRKTEAQAELKAEIGDLPGVETVVVHGHAGRTIVDWADQTEADCVIVSSHRPGLQDYLLGSTANRVVRHAKCAVHVIR